MPKCLKLTDSISIHCSLNSIKQRLFWDYGTLGPSVHHASNVTEEL